MSYTLKVVSGTQTIVATNLGSEIASGSKDFFRQGANIRDINDLTNYVSFKFRSNSSLVKTFNGRDSDQSTFDDTQSPILFSTGTITTPEVTYKNPWFLGGETVVISPATTTELMTRVAFSDQGRVSQRVSHHAEIRDLGQSSYYDENFYGDWQDLEPQNIIRKHPLSQRFPDQLVSLAGKSDFDGVIEPFFIRKVIDGSIIDHPYVSRGINGSIGGSEDAYRRVAIITDSVEIEEQTDGDPVAFLDHLEIFGSGSGAIDLPGAFLPEAKNIFPFSDVSDREVMTKNITVNPAEDVTIREVLISGSNFNDDDSKVHEINANRGFTFHYGEFGYDSIAFGGLKK